jgi:hypothetical protein
MRKLRIRNLTPRTLFPNRELCDNIHKLWGGPLRHNAPPSMTRLQDRNASSRFLIVTQNQNGRNRARLGDAPQRVAPFATLRAPDSTYVLLAVTLGSALNFGSRSR